jgi:hypothetical protein
MQLATCTQNMATFPRKGSTFPLSAPRFGAPGLFVIVGATLELLRTISSVLPARSFGRYWVLLGFRWGSQLCFPERAQVCVSSSGVLALFLSPLEARLDSPRSPWIRVPWIFYLPPLRPPKRRRVRIIRSVITLLTPTRTPRHREHRRRHITPCWLVVLTGYLRRNLQTLLPRRPSPGARQRHLSLPHHGNLCSCLPHVAPWPRAMNQHLLTS